MTASSLIIRPPLSPDERRERLEGYVQVAQSFSPDPLPEDTATRLLRKLSTFPGYRPAQVRSAYRNGEQLGDYRISERLLCVGAARLPTGCIGGVYTRPERLSRAWQPRSYTMRLLRAGARVSLVAARWHSSVLRPLWLLRCV